LEEKEKIGVPETAGPSEPELVARARRGDKSAFGLLVKMHQRRLLRMALGMTGDSDSAMDIVQESFVKAYQALDRFEEGQPFYPWLSTIAVNLVINRSRRTKRESRLDSAADDYRDRGPDPQETLQMKETERRFLEAVRELPDAYREVFILRSFEELDYEEIARRLGISVGTVDSRLYRARRALVDKLKEFLP